jgi:hypothetical protein
MKRIIAGVLGTLFSLSVVHAYALRLEVLRPVQFVPTLSAVHFQQVALIRRHVPAGSTILYLDQKVDPWELGLFRRTLYPDYTVVPAESDAEVIAARTSSPSPGRPVRGILVARRYQGQRGNPDLLMALPEDSPGIPLELGIWTGGPATP